MSSSRRVILWSAMRPSTSVSHACGSTPFSLAVWIRVYAMAAAWAFSGAQASVRRTLTSGGLSGWVAQARPSVIRRCSDLETLGADGRGCAKNRRSKARPRQSVSDRTAADAGVRPTTIGYGHAKNDFVWSRCIRDRYGDCVEVVK